MSLPQTVIAEIRRRVHSHDRQLASELLETCATSLNPAHRERILLGIVRLAGRHTDRLTELIEVANEDHRNIEYWHYWPDENRAQFFQHERQEEER